MISMILMNLTLTATGEHKDFLLVNELLLKESGASWNQPDKFSINKLSKVRLNEIKVLAEKAIGKMDHHPNWVVKDPRMWSNLRFLERTHSWLMCYRYAQRPQCK